MVSMPCLLQNGAESSGGQSNGGGSNAAHSKHASSNGVQSRPAASSNRVQSKATAERHSGLIREMLDEVKEADKSVAQVRTIMHPHRSRSFWVQILSAAYVLKVSSCAAKSNHSERQIRWIR